MHATRPKIIFWTSLQFMSNLRAMHISKQNIWFFRPADWAPDTSNQLSSEFLKCAKPNIFLARIAAQWCCRLSSHRRRFQDFGHDMYSVISSKIDKVYEEVTIGILLQSVTEIMPLMDWKLEQSYCRFKYKESHRLVCSLHEFDIQIKSSFRPEMQWYQQLICGS